VRWLVGDVQGCARELDDLLEQVRFDPGRDELWCLGDLVNRGPDSLGALRLWMDVGGRGLLGNHDVYALRAHDRRTARRKDTLDDLFAAPDVDGLLRALLELPVLVELPGGTGFDPVWVVHAGLDPTWGDLHEVSRRVNGGAGGMGRLDDPDLAFATTVRCCTPDGRRCKHSGVPEDCPAPFVPWDDLYAGATLVVHGHWARRGYYRGPRTMGLDSGCVYGGTLTAWNHEEDRIVQIPSRASGAGPRRVDLGQRKR
jgi:bis(5'-nucleosyl)-tetraphosphatase (symmetrical)